MGSGKCLAAWTPCTTSIRALKSCTTIFFETIHFKANEHFENHSDICSTSALALAIEFTSQRGILKLLPPGGFELRMHSRTRLFMSKRSCNLSLGYSFQASRICSSSLSKSNSRTRGRRLSSDLLKPRSHPLVKPTTLSKMLLVWVHNYER